MNRLLIIVVFFLINCVVNGQNHIIYDANNKPVAFENDQHDFKIGIKNKHLTDTVLTDTSTAINGMITADPVDYNLEIIEIADTLNSHSAFKYKRANNISDMNLHDLGNYNPETKEFRDANNDLLFKFNASNEIVSASNVKLGYLLNENELYGNDGFLLGKSKGIENYKLVYYFMFYNK